MRNSEIEMLTVIFSIWTEIFYPIFCACGSLRRYLRIANESQLWGSGSIDRGWVNVNISPSTIELRTTKANRQHAPQLQQQDNRSGRDSNH